MSAGSRIAAKIAKGIAKAGKKTGNGPMYCVLRRPQSDGPSDPWSSGGTGPTYHEITAMQKLRKVKDGNGSFIGKTKTVLMVTAQGVIPSKADYIAINIRKADVTESTRFDEIADVETLATGGVDLKYDVVLSD